MACSAFQALGSFNNQEIVETAYDLIKGIKDPEKPHTLEELDVVKEEDIFLFLIKSGKWVLETHFTPTVPHCHFATVIGLSIKVKLQECLPKTLKIEVKIKKGCHDTEREINKQLEDKERVAAAMENPNLNELIRKCLQDS